MDTTRIMAVSIKGRIRMEEAAAAEVEQKLVCIIEALLRAVISDYLPLNLKLL